MEWILQWVKSGLLFGIVSSVILMLCPNKSYAKHIGLVVGLLFILVMLHPVMELMQIDEDTYISYIRDFFAVSGSPDEISGDNLQLYEEAVAMQVKAALSASGYPVDKIEVQVEEDGSVSKVSISFSDAVNNVEVPEQYIREMFGEEVCVQYEGNW